MIIIIFINAVFLPISNSKIATIIIINTQTGIIITVTVIITSKKMKDFSQLFCQLVTRARQRDCEQITDSL